MISRRQIISGSAGPIFAIFTSNENVLGVDDRSGHLFFDISGDIAMATYFVPKMANSPLSSLWHSETEWDSADDACILCENFVKFGPVTPELTGLIWYDVVKKWTYLV